VIGALLSPRLRAFDDAKAGGDGYKDLVVWIKVPVLSFWERNVYLVLASTSTVLLIK